MSKQRRIRQKHFWTMELRRARRKNQRRSKVKDRRRRAITEECRQNYQRNLHRKKVAKQYFEKKYRKYKTRTAPVNFSILDNSEEVIEFCNKLRKDFRNRRKVFVNMQQVTTVTNESLCLLVSNMMLFQEGRIDFNGNFPMNHDAFKVVMESGFLDKLYRRRNSVNNVNSPIYTHSAQKSNSDITDAIILSCSKFLWGEECNCSGVYNAFIELMTNTVEHADEIEGKQKWWLTATKDEMNEKVTFSFVDYGRGIINTLTSATQKRHKNTVDRLLSKWFGNEAMLLKEVMEGALIVSEKDGTQFGNGLNSIYQDMMDGQIDNVVIISNNVFADVKTGNYHKMNVSFPGTYICWEINKETKHEIICSNPVYEETGAEVYQPEQ